MLRVLKVLLLSLIVLTVKAHPEPQKTQKTSRSNQPSQAAANIKPEQPSSPELAKEPSNHAQADVRIISTPSKDGYDKAAIWINFVLALLGGLGIAVALATLMKIKVQADEMSLQRKTMEDTLEAVKVQGELMKRQTAIQEASLRQWVDVELVKIKDSIIDPQKTGDTPSVCANIHFKAFNNTPLPLTVKRIVTSVSRAGAMEWAPFVVEETILLPPKTGSESNSYPFFVPITLTGEAAQWYLEGTHYFSVVGQILFDEAIQRESKQHFSYVVHHKPGGFRILEYGGKDPTAFQEEPETQDQRPKPN